ncbi:MAG: amino acid ABC transporter substrate-binding protein [Desulfamplus sp.]|nr:amino acid ABC transporter substrate-binding protein [Desulfamplus sp.]
MAIFLSGISLWVPLLFSEPGRLDHIRQSGEVKICVWPDYYSISYRNPKTRELIGIDVDMAHELAKDLEVKPVFVESSFATLIEDVQNDRCDIAMFGIGITPSRQKHLRFTEPHLKSDIYAITTRSNRIIQSWKDIDHPDVVVAVARGTLHEKVMQRKLSHAELIILDTPHAREQEVESGRADVFMTDYPYSRKMLATTDWARLVKPDSVYHITPYAYAMKQGDDPWYRAMTDFVRRVKADGRLVKAAQRHGLEPIVITD